MTIETLPSPVEVAIICRLGSFHLPQKLLRLRIPGKMRASAPSISISSTSIRGSRLSSMSLPTVMPCGKRLSSSYRSRTRKHCSKLSCYTTAWTCWPANSRQASSGVSSRILWAARTPIEESSLRRCHARSSASSKASTVTAFVIKPV